MSNRVLRRLQNDKHPNRQALDVLLHEDTTGLLLPVPLLWGPWELSLQSSERRA